MLNYNEIVVGTVVAIVSGMKTNKIKTIRLSLSVGGKLRPVYATYLNIKGGYWLGRLTGRRWDGK